jgi:ribosomal protein L40E
VRGWVFYGGFIMKVRDRQKICSHCEGRIAVEADTCLYCGMPLLEDKPSIKKEEESSSLNSLYPPPYSSRSISEEKKVDTSADYMSRFQTSQREPAPAEAPEGESVKALREEETASFSPILMALLGSNLLILGLMQCFFSEDGFLRLEWNAQYWFIFCLTSLPLLYFGMRKTEKK